MSHLNPTLSPMKLKPSFGLWTSVSIIIGSVIGSGIFMKPATMAAQLGSPELLIAVWIGAGIISLFGALSIAELAALMPDTGGLYVYFRKIYGEFFAFIFGWACFIVINTAAVASIAYICGTYAEYFISLPSLSYEAARSIDLYIPFIGHIYPLENIGVKGITILVMLLLSVLNYVSTRAGGKLTLIVTALKLVAIFLIIAGLLFSPSGDVSYFFWDSATVQLSGWALVASIIAASSGAFWGYDGWINITYVAGEVKDPQRNIPKSLFIGIAACIMTYVLINLAFLFVLNIDGVAASTMVASEAAMVITGVIGGGIVALLVFLSTAGTTQSNILATTRISYAMAEKGNFFRVFGKIHPRFGTPGNAIMIHAIWTSILVLSGSFDMLTDMVIFMSYIFYAMGALGVFILRNRMPEVVRPYSVWGYPVVPGIFVVVVIFFLVVTLSNDITNYMQGTSPVINSVLGLILTATGIPLYFYFRKKHNQVPV